MIEVGHNHGVVKPLMVGPQANCQVALGNELECEARLRQGQRVLVAGCGYLGRVVARCLHASGWEVTGITQSPESALLLQSEPFRVLSCDIGDRVALASLGSFDAVVSCVSSGRGGEDAYRRIYLEGTRNLIEVLRPSRLVFTGSTSVYAQNDGGLVTEESPTEPQRETGKILLAAEALVLAAGGTVARVAGIYGPGRWVCLERFLDGRAVIEGEGSRFINQVHRADAASALVFLLTDPALNGVYNVADDAPVPQIEVYEAFAAHFHRSLPPAGVPDLNRKRGWTHKRVINAKLHALGWSPLYPSFRDALSALPRL